ncbi:uncharacterized protein LOC113354477 [Papaver somniferum]|uniref:uncharacterized protein LOC113354477 n=1 Tax=Papaver somniferum TaxID=3469 RepID=UPI000E6FDDF5|nr:uncharacterized protein LOC113354477 [Papaver somniferum]
MRNLQIDNLVSIFLRGQAFLKVFFVGVLSVLIAKRLSDGVRVILSFAHLCLNYDETFMMLNYDVNGVFKQVTAKWRPEATQRFAPRGHGNVHMVLVCLLQGWMNQENNSTTISQVGTTSNTMPLLLGLAHNLLKLVWNANLSPLPTLPVMI